MVKSRMETSPMKTSYEFGIVGGGMAGLSAAHALKRKGIDS
jgi:cation diffusion facilitator CzcD-associated flavoprotein CzcO